MKAWWENVSVWFGALEPLAKIAVAIAGLLLLVGVLRGLLGGSRRKTVGTPFTPAASYGAPPIQPRITPPSAPAPRDEPKEEARPVPVSASASALPLSLATGSALGRYVDLEPLDRALVEQAFDAFRRRAGKGGEVGLAPILAEAEEGRGARLLARAEAEYAKAAGPQALGEAAWRLAGLTHPEDRTRALALYREATGLAPHLAGAWLGRARAAEAAGESAESVEALERAVSRAREPRLRAAVLAEQAARALAAEQTAEALRIASESAALWRPFALEQTPAGEAAQTALAAVLGSSGEAAQALGDWAQARLRFEEAMELTAYLATRRPADVERAWAAGEAADRMADFQEAEVEARQAAQAALAARRAAAAERRESGVTAVKIGDSLRMRGKTEEARAQYAEALEIFDELALKSPSSATARRDRAVALERLGDAAFALGDLEEARRRLEASFQLREARAAVDSSDSESRRDLVLALIKLGDVGRALGEPGAEGRYGRALDLARGLPVAGPDQVPAAHVLVLALDRAATVAPAGEARALYEEIRRILQPLAEAGRLSPEQRAALSAVEAHLAGSSAA
ncbi:tetratricopeptide repeat protein [Neomegalonema sp.]|uniref:tetratricopeptide repeat protein n=1 Tax=Neomegalonema sp. TaxID=2039713 RepID=UPI00262115EA|nr:tetratricopeptide repeat protein [Neomegalonema sp.]MDD2869140.1 tetratricopeptide repeat protein [Neomegalonema sp.]